MTTIAQLEALALTAAPVVEGALSARSRGDVIVTRRDMRNQVTGALRLMVFLSGGKPNSEVSEVVQMSRCVDALEQEVQQLRKVLAQIGKVLEPHCDPFEAKPPSKWKADEAKTWMLEAARSIEWAMTAAENALDPRHEQPIAAGPEVA